MTNRRNGGNAGFANPDDELDGFSAATSGTATASEALDDEVDFSTVDERLANAYPTLENGDYDGVVKKCEFTISKSEKRNPMWAWQIEVKNPETGRMLNVRHWTMLTKDKVADAKAEIMAVAPDLELNNGTMNIRELPAEFINRRVRIRVVKSPDTRKGNEGLFQNRIRKFLSLDDTGADNLSDFLN